MIMKIRILIFWSSFILFLFPFGVGESYSSINAGPVPDWQWVESNDISSVYVDMNKKDFQRVDKNTFSCWIAITNINDQSITFYHIMADTLNKKYRNDRSIRFDSGKINIDTNEFDKWSPQWTLYDLTYQASAINYIINHVSNLEGKK